MIETIPQIRAADSFSVTVSLIVYDHGGAGIQQIRVNDRFGIELFGTELDDCPELFEADLGIVSRTRLPLFVEARDCNGEVTPPDIPILHGEVQTGEPDPRRLPCSAVNCDDNPACTRATGEVQLARNGLIGWCHRARSSERQRDLLMATWLGLLALMAALMAAAAVVAGVPFFGGILSAVLVSTALAVGVFAVFVFAEYQRARRDASRAREQLGEARLRFEQAVARALEVCCPHCIFVDLDMPEC